LLKPLADDKLKEALQKIASKRREKEKTQKRGKVLTLLGAKGGSGVTTVATHLASFLPKIRSCKTLLIDHHSDLGDVSVYLGLDKHLYHFYELVNNVHRLDSELLAGFVLRHSSGLEVLASPDSLNTVNPTEGVSEQHMEQTIEFLRSVYDVIIIDCAPGFTGLNIAAIQPADEVCLIANPEIPAIRNLSRYLSHLARFSAPAERVRVVINRYSRKGPITEEQIEKVLQRPVSRTIPNNYAEVIQAINTGKPIIPLKSSEFVRAIQDWAETLAPDSMEAFAKEEPRKRFGLLRF
jgi:pilus assembly protein CpaE